MDGWIKLHRKLLDNPVFQNEKLLKMFVWCLLKAAHEGYTQLVGLQVVEVGKSQFIYGRNKASIELKMKPSSVHKLLKKLQELKIIDVKSNNKFSLVTIVNWELYQSKEKKVTAEEQQRNNNVTTKEQQSNTNKKVKNLKNDKNDKKVKKSTYAENVTMLPDEYEKLLKEHGESKTKRMIEILDNYKGANNKKYASDYRAILNWVVDRYDEDLKKKPKTMLENLKDLYDEEVQSEQSRNNPDIIDI